MSTLRYTIEGISDTPPPKNTVQVLRLLVEPVLNGLDWAADSSSVHYDDHDGRPLIRLHGRIPKATDFGEVDSRARRFAAIELLTPEESLHAPISVPTRGERLDILARTNGFVWSIYLPLAKGPYHCKDIDIRKSSKRAASLLGRYLRKDRLSEGEAGKEAERQLKPSEERVSSVLDEMLQQPPQQLIRLIQEYYESKLGRRPDDELVTRVLKSRLPQGDDDEEGGSLSR